MADGIYNVRAYDGMTAEVKEVETKKAFESMDCTPLHDTIITAYYNTVDKKSKDLLRDIDGCYGGTRKGGASDREHIGSEAYTTDDHII